MAAQRFGLDFWGDLTPHASDVDDGVHEFPSDKPGVRLMYSFAAGVFTKHAIADDDTCTDTPCSIRDVPARVLIALRRAAG